MTATILKSHQYAGGFKRLSMFFILFLSGIILQAQTVGDFQSAGSGNWDSNATWQVWDGIAWTTPTLPLKGPPSDGSITVTILNTHTVTIVTSTSIAKTVVQPGGQLTIGPSKTVTFVNTVTGDKLTVNGTVLNNGSIAFSGTTVINAGGVLDNHSALNFSGSSLQLSVNGTLKNSSSTAITTASTDRVAFNNGSVYEHAYTTTSGTVPTATWNTGSTCRISGYTSSLVFPQNTDQPFYNFEWNTPGMTSTAFLALGAVNGNLSIVNTGSGTLAMQSLRQVGIDFTTSSSTHVQLANLDFQVGRNVSFGSGSITSSDGINLTLNGTASNQSVDVNGLAINNLTINNPAHSITLASALNINGIVSVASTHTTLISNGHLRLLSSNDDGYNNDASIGSLPDGSSINGNVTIERYMSNEGDIYRYISSPVSNFSVSSFQNDVPVYGSFTGANTCPGIQCTASLYSYDAASSAYVPFPNSPQTNAVTFDKGRGYAGFINQSGIGGPITIHWTGTINQGTIDIPVGYNSASPTNSWNLVGNPYPSTIDWDKGQSGTGWSFTNVAQAVAVKDNSTGAFQYYPDDVGNETFNHGQIAKGQAFWVRTTGSNPTLQIREDAKVSEIGTFYRKDTRSAATDRIVLTLSNGDISDRAYFKIAENASAQMDYYDAPKMTNVGASTLNLATLLPGAAVRMAINAVGNVACSDTIKLKMNGPGTQKLAAGTYKFSLASSGIMNNFSWMLKDSYTHSSTDISTIDSYSFDVTANAASLNEDRFQLIAVKKAVDHTLPLAGTTQVCGDVSGTVKISNSQAQTNYSIEINGKSSQDFQQGNGSDVIFTIASGALTTGKNLVKVFVNAGCTQEYLTDSVVVVKSAYYLPQVKSTPHCQQGSVTLQASNITDSNTVRWYASKESVEALTTGTMFSTPVLSRSKTYYAAGVNAAGCESDRVAVSATIINFDSVHITQENENVLQSSYEDGNQWYLNDQPIEGANDATIAVKEIGTYSVQVSVEGCTTSARYNVTNAVTAIEQKLETAVLVYPNPVTTAPLHIEVPATVQSVRLLNSTGLVLIDNIVFSESSDGVKKVDVQLSQYPSGIYMVHVVSGSESRVIKVAKN